jgi:polyhydroxybutyrate depolymerase
MSGHIGSHRPERVGARRAIGSLALAAITMVMLAVGSQATPAFAAPSPAHPAIAPGPGATATLSAATVAGGGCGKTVDAGSSTLSISVGGHERTVIVHIPTGYTGTAKVPLVLNMHGSGSTAAEQELFTGMDAESDTAGFIVAYPQALIPSGTGFDWNIPGVPLAPGAHPPAHRADDMAFLTGLVGIFEQRYCVNTARVYATGFSGGARITSQLACDDSNIFAAVAPVSGLRRPTPCPTLRPVPVVSFHGIADPVDPYNGHGHTYWVYSVPTAASYWATQDGCRTLPVTSTPFAGVTLTRYVGCKAGSAVELYSIAGEGHEWPDGPHLPPRITRVLGPQSTAVNANAVIWAFFSAHTLG